MPLNERGIRETDQSRIKQSSRRASILLIPQFCPHRPGTVRFLHEMEAPHWPRGLRWAPFRPNLYTMCPYGLQSNNRSSQFSGVFCDSQAFSWTISISRDSRLPLDKKTKNISRKNEILILHGTGCIAANGTPQICGFQHFWTNCKPVLRTVPFPEGVPSVEDRIGGSAIRYSQYPLLSHPDAHDRHAGTGGLQCACRDRK